MLSQVSQEEEEEVFFRELLVWKDTPHPPALGWCPRGAGTGKVFS